MTSTQTKIQTELSLKMPVSYYLHRAPDSKALAILLHGYTDSANSFFQRAFTEHLPSFNVLAPNAPYPMPVKTPSGYKEKYAWYFSDPRTGFVLVKPEVSVRYLKQLVTELKFDQHEITLVGFSQGGFLAPHLARVLPNVKKIIGVGCAFRLHDYETLDGFSVDAIHGADDDIITLEQAKKTYEELRAARNIKGEFHVIPDLKHTMNAEARAALLRSIAG